MGRHYRNIEGDFIRHERRQARFAARREVQQELVEYVAQKTIDSEERAQCTESSKCNCWMCVGLRRWHAQEHWDYITSQLQLPHATKTIS